MNWNLPNRRWSVFEENGADWWQQQECERERWELTLEALEACEKNVASAEQVAFIARELGINWKKEHRNAA